MSWDVMVFNFQGKTPPPVGSMGEDSKSDPMGAADEARTIISTHLPAVDWSDPTWGLLEGEGFSIECNMGEHPMTDSYMLHVRGGGDPLPAIMSLCTSAGWTALDCSTGEWLSSENPSNQGWEGFQHFRDRVIGAVASPTECPGCGRKLQRAGRSPKF